MFAGRTGAYSANPFSIFIFSTSRILTSMQQFFISHDPECRASGFKGLLRDLPHDVNIEIDEFLLDYELSTLNESSIVKDARNANTESKDEGEIDEFDDASLEEAMGLLDISKATLQPDTVENEGCVLWES